MAATLSLTETATELIYSGLGDSTGLRLIIQKDSSNLDVREIVPAALAGTTWQAMRDELASRLV